ncbi:hypothetical protein [Comamonas kerstersii]
MKGGFFHGAWSRPGQAAYIAASFLRAASACQVNISNTKLSEILIYQALKAHFFDGFVPEAL